MTLHILDEVFTNGFTYNVINFITLLSILSGIFVIISKNPIVSILFLISLFLNIACYLMMLGLNFIGLSYLLVYIGAVSILFLFILMLINVRISELSSDNSNSIPLAIITGVFFYFTINTLLLNDTVSEEYGHLSLLMNNSEFNDKFNILYVTSQSWDNYLAEVSHITSIGNIIYTAYPMWLILTSLILLLAMVGAIIITIK